MLQLQLQKLSPTGVERLYGFPGVETLALLEACRKAGIEFLLTHHEASAAFMAAADMCNFNVKISLSVNTGPGATNLTTGIAHV
jgi:acetolactate synthase-1/2/3 large subunit